MIEQSWKQKSVYWIFTVVFVSLITTINAQSAQIPSKFIRSIYGFSSNSEPFKGMENEAMLKWLQDHAINSVFVSPSEDRKITSFLRKHGIHIYQEFTVFTGRTYYKEHPEWRPITLDGEDMKPDGWYHGLNPNHPELRKLRLDQYRKRLQNPDLEGIWLDFIRYPVRWEGTNPRIEESSFDRYSLQRFQEFARIELPNIDSPTEAAQLILNKYPQQWMEFKIESIRSWCEAAKKIRDEIRPDVLIGLFGVPWLECDFDNAIHRIVGQDFSVLASVVDVFSPMVYHRLCGRPFEWIGTVTRSVLQESQKPVWPIVQAMDDTDLAGPLEKKEMPSDEFRQAIWHGAQTSKTGVIIFTARYVQQEDRWEDVKDIFKKCNQEFD